MGILRSILVGVAAAVSTLVLCICASVALSIGLAEWQALQPGFEPTAPGGTKLHPRVVDGAGRFGRFRDGFRVGSPADLRAPRFAN